MFRPLGTGLRAALLVERLRNIVERANEKAATADDRGHRRNVPKPNIDKPNGRRDFAF